MIETMELFASNRVANIHQQHEEEEYNYERALNWLVEVKHGLVDPNTRRSVVFFGGEPASTSIDDIDDKFATTSDPFFTISMDQKEVGVGNEMGHIRSYPTYESNSLDIAFQMMRDHLE